MSSSEVDVLSNNTYDHENDYSYEEEISPDIDEIISNVSKGTFKSKIKDDISNMSYGSRPDMLRKTSVSVPKVVSNNDEMEDITFTSAQPQSPCGEDINSGYDGTNSSTYSEITILDILNDENMSKKTDENSFDIVTYFPNCYYTIKSTNLADFYVVYCSNLYNSGTGRPATPVGEKVSRKRFPFGVIFSNIDLDGAESTIAAIIQDCIRDNIEKAEDYYMYCVCTYGDDNCEVRSIRFSFPYLVLSHSDADILYQIIINKLSNKAKNILSRDFKKNVRCCNDGKDIELYGSHKSISSAPHNKYVCYGPSRNNKGVPMSIDIVNAFNVKDCDFLKIVGPDRLEQFDDKDLLPIILSKHFCKEQVHFRQSKPYQIGTGAASDSDTQNYLNKFDEEVQELLNLVSGNRFKNSVGCNDIAYILCDIYRSTESGIERAIERFKGLLEIHGYDAVDAKLKVLNQNKRTNMKMTRDQYIRNIFRTKRETHYSIKSLESMAQEDSRVQFNDLRNKRIRNFLESMGECDPLSIANLLYEMYRSEFAYDSINKKWIFFYAGPFGNIYKPQSYKNYKWNVSDNDTTFREFVNTKFLKDLEKTKLYYSQYKDSGATSGSEKTVAKKVIEVIDGIIGKVAKSDNSIVLKAKNIFKIDRMFDWLDVNPYVIGLDNKMCIAFNVEGGKVNYSIRVGRPEDYISRSMKTTYDPNLSEDSYEVRLAREFMESVYPNPELRNCMLRLLASRLIGGNPEKYVVAMVGEGNTGKSTMCNVITEIFGDSSNDGYTGVAPNTIITNKSRGGSANPEQAAAVNNRILFLHEMAEKDEIEADEFKRLSGNDLIFVRFLFSNGRNARPLYVVFIASNNIPVIRYARSAEEERLIIFTHEGLFVDAKDLPATVEEQKKQRKFLKDKFIDIPQIARGLFRDIIKIGLKEYIEEGIKIPDVIRETNREYWSDKDIFRIFLNKNMRLVINDKGELDKTCKIKVDVAYKRFLSWYTEFYPGSKEIPNVDLFKKHLAHVTGQKKVGNDFEGVILDARDEDEEQTDE